MSKWGVLVAVGGTFLARDFDCFGNKLDAPYRLIDMTSYHESLKPADIEWLSVPVPTSPS